MKTLLILMSLAVLAGCGTRQFALHRADGAEAGTVSVHRGLQTDEVIIAETNKPPRIFLCDWASTLSGTKCWEAK